MDIDEFDHAVIRAVFDQAALRGWGDVSLAEVALDAGLDLARLRARFPSRNAVLLRFGVHADAAALAAANSPGTPREKLFDMLMNRFEALQLHRGGIMALLAALPSDPGSALVLGAATLGSMRWLLEAAGVPVSGPVGILRVNGLLAAWLYALRAWQRDESADLAGTMAAVDRALDRAMQAERSLPFRPRAVAEPPPEPAVEPVAEPEPPTVMPPDDLPGSSPTVI